MTPEQFVALFTGNVLPLLTKVVLLIIIFLYGIFAAVVLRQVQLMNKVVTEVGFSPVLFSVALIHLIAVVIIFILTILLA